MVSEHLQKCIIIIQRLTQRLKTIKDWSQMKWWFCRFPNIPFLFIYFVDCLFCMLYFILDSKLHYTLYDIWRHFNMCVCATYSFLQPFIFDNSAWTLVLYLKKKVATWNKKQNLSDFIRAYFSRLKQKINWDITEIHTSTSE